MNKKTINFNDEELCIINRIMETRSKIAKFSVTFEYIVHGWEDLVNTLSEEENKLSVEEYTNELFKREIIYEIIYGGCKNKDFILWQKKLDDKFVKNTNLVDRPLMELPGQKENWWWYRIPKSNNSHFLDILDSYGYSITQE